MKIAFTVTSLIRAGGIERVALMLAQGMINMGYHITIILLEGEKSFYPIPKHAQLIPLKLQREGGKYIYGIINNIHRIIMLRKAIINSNPDIVISFSTIPNILAIISLIGLKYKCIVNQQSDLRLGEIPLPWIILSRLFYGKASKIVSVSKDIDSYFNWVSNSKKVVIHNPLVDTESIASDKIELKVDKNYNHIIAMGRLVRQKGFDLLLKAYSMIAKQYSDWNLIIIGDGILKSVLMNEIESLNIKNRVNLLGNLKNPFPVLVQSQIFVLSSRWEPFGIALIEAMSLGMPVISYNCPGGPSEIINHEKNGLIVPNGNIKALALSIEKLILDDKFRKIIGQQAKLDVKDSFDFKIILQKWDNLIADVKSGKGNPSCKDFIG